MSQPRDDRQDEFRPALEKIIDLRHPLVRLAGTIDFLRGTSVRHVGWGQGSRRCRRGWWRAVYSRTHAQSFRRGVVRPMGGEPVLPILLWRGWCSATRR